jgi:hypothetical protein
LFVLK